MLCYWQAISPTARVQVKLTKPREKPPSKVTQIRSGFSKSFQSKQQNLRLKKGKACIGRYFQWHSVATSNYELKSVATRLTRLDAHRSVKLEAHWWIPAAPVKPVDRQLLSDQISCNWRHRTSVVPEKVSSLCVFLDDLNCKCWSSVICDYIIATF